MHTKQDTCRKNAKSQIKNEQKQIRQNQTHEQGRKERRKQRKKRRESEGCGGEESIDRLDPIQVIGSKGKDCGNRPGRQDPVPRPNYHTDARTPVCMAMTRQAAFLARAATSAHSPIASS